MKKILEKIAKNVLDIETLEAQNSDSGDFHMISVWELEEALQEAFLAGKAEAEKKK